MQVLFSFTEKNTGTRANNTLEGNNAMGNLRICRLDFTIFQNARFFALLDARNYTLRPRQHLAVLPPTFKQNHLFPRLIHALLSTCNSGALSKMLRTLCNISASIGFVYHTPPPLPPNTQLGSSRTPYNCNIRSTHPLQF